MVVAGVTEQSRRLAPLPLYAALAAAVPLTVAVANLTADRLAIAGALSGLFLALTALVHTLTGRVFASRWVWVGPLVIGTVLFMIATFRCRLRRSRGRCSRWRAAHTSCCCVATQSSVAAMGALLGVVAAVQFLPAVAATVSAGLMSRCSTR